MPKDKQKPAPKPPDAADPKLIIDLQKTGGGVTTMRPAPRSDVLKKVMREDQRK